MFKNNISSLFSLVADLANRSLEKIEGEIEQFVVSIYISSSITKTCNGFDTNILQEKSHRMRLYGKQKMHNNNILNEPNTKRRLKIIVPYIPLDL